MKKLTGLLLLLTTLNGCGAFAVPAGIISNLGVAYIRNNFDSNPLKKSSHYYNVKKVKVEEYDIGEGCKIQSFEIDNSQVKALCNFCDGRYLGGFLLKCREEVIGIYLYPNDEKGEDDLKGFQTISDEEKRLLGNKLKINLNFRTHKYVLKE